MDKSLISDRVDKAIISPDFSICNILSQLDRAGFGILLVCNESKQLLGVVTDGDVRRAILKRVSFDDPCNKIMNTNPIVANMPITADEALHIMDTSRKYLLNHLPVVDEGGHVIGLILRQDLIKEMPEISAVVMAGGFGTRLRPLTEETPKPMLPVGDKPLMQIILEQLRDSGIKNVNVTTHYKPEKIEGYFGDGSSLGVRINYVNEERPLGTAGSLNLVDSPKEPLLVINGDILTRINFRAMLMFHRENGADMTVAVRSYDVPVPYGVVEVDGPRVKELKEKPTIRLLVNAGIYLLEPSVHDYIPTDQRFDMTDLIQRLINDGRNVVSFPIIEYWLDIGQHTDYHKAQEDFKKWGINP